MRGLLIGCWLAILAMALPGASALAQATSDLVDRSALRVCADPHDLPFSNEAGEGFENKIAELMAARLQVPLEYTWYPQSVGFVRNTLRADLCDLIVGVVAADQLVQTTNPYYRSAYMIVVRDEDKDRLTSLDVPDAKEARIGVFAGTPPADVLRRKGLLAHVRSYTLVVDTRVEHSVRDMLHDLASGAIDIALPWGPAAGYWIKQDKLPLTYVPLTSDPQSRERLDFRIAMGVRQGEQDWKREINRLIRELQPEIDRILTDYGVPRLDEQGRLITPPPALERQGADVPEPEGYRTDNYRAPVPASLKGATVLDTPALKQLIATGRPVLIDVLPKQRKPKDRDPDQLWIEPKRDDIPGSVWLPNTGYGELSPDFRQYFTDQLAALTGGDRTKAVVFYCDTDCWMSWNAAKRAIQELGYRQVYWYPPGVEGWKNAGNPLAPAHAAPMPDWAG